MRPQVAGAAARLSIFAERVFHRGGVMNAVAGGRREQRTGLAMQYMTWRKALNFLRTELAYIRGQVKPKSSPFEWEIDTTNICQLKCPLCHTGLGNIKREQGVMHYDVFTDTVDQIKDSAFWLTLYSWGEPFLNPRIHDFVRYAHDQGIATMMSSNLNRPLTDEMAENIVRSGLDVLIVSLDGTTQDVYEVYRVNGHLDRVLNNIRLLAAKKRELGMQTPYLEWQFIVMRQNEHQMDDARRMADELGMDDIIFKKVDFPHQMEDPAIAEQWLPQSLAYQRGNAFDKPYEEDGDRCWRLWRSAVVNWDGGFSPCCYLTDQASDFGDVTKQSVAEIWNGPAYRTARALFKDDFTPIKSVGCITCPVYTESPTGERRGIIDRALEPANPQSAPLLTNLDWASNGSNGGTATSDASTGSSRPLEPETVVPRTNGAGPAGAGAAATATEAAADHGEGG